MFIVLGVEKQIYEIVFVIYYTTNPAVKKYRIIYETLDSDINRF